MSEIDGITMNYNGDCRDEKVIHPMTKDEAIEFLFGLLDEIDTADDMAKGNCELYRKLVQRYQLRRWETGITTDGYTLDTSAFSTTP